MEKAHDISLDEPCVAHQAILFMLDVLMRNNKSNLTLAELYDSFGDKSFTPQMLRAVGGNEQGLKQFLLRYPSLFSVNGDTISANSGGSQLPRNSTTPERYLRKTKTKNQDGSSGDVTQNTVSSNQTGDSANSTSSSSSSTISSNGQQTIATNEVTQLDARSMKEIEQEAIAFFRKQISKREEDWLPIVSVAGHASQSSTDVRKFVGPQNEFKAFLVKYPSIFIVRDEYCGLKGKADVSIQPFPPPSPPPKRRTANVTLIGTNGITNGIAALGAGPLLTRGHSFKASNRYSACGNMMPNQTLNLVSANSLMQQMPQGAQQLQVNAGINSSQGISKPRLTPLEVKAVHYVMRILHKNGRMLLQTIPGLISRAPDQVSNIVGFTREDLIQFFKRHSAIFQLHPDGCVSVKQDAVKALILKDNLNGSLANNVSSDFNSNAVISSNGVILRIFPKYGILNMENNEQVFFDIQSCQFETFSDLTTILHTGDRLYFNAIIGPRDGSTKWRSLKTWIKMRSQPSSSNGIISTFDNMSTHSDAEKSDDSSSSSQGGYSKRNNQGASNGLITNTNQIYQNAHYNIIGNSSNHSNFSVPSSVSNSVTQNSIVNSHNINCSPTNFNVDNDTSINETMGSNGLSGNSNMLMSLSGDFNLYQLDSGDYNHANSSPDAISTLGGAIEEGSEFLISSTHSNNIIHSSSSNSLASKSLLLQNENDNNVNTPNQDLKPVANSSKNSTKFIRQSADNISEKLVSEINPRLVSMGCQTFSTGDITVSNVYIE